MATLAQEVSQLRLGEKAFVVEGRDLQLGRLSLRLVSGKVAPVLAGERPLEWFFAGTGEMTFTLGDPLAEPVFRYNLEKATSLKLVGQDQVQMPVETALVLTSGDSQELFGTGLPEGGQANQEAFQRHRQRFAGDLGWQPQDLLPAGLLEGEQQLFVELSGGKEDLTFIHDSVVLGEERLTVAKTIRRRNTELEEFVDRREQEEIARVPLGCSRLEFIPDRFPLSHLDVTVVHPGGIRGEVSAKETFTLLQPARVLSLEL